MRPPNRRHFLQDTAALAAGFAAIPGVAARADEPADDKDGDAKPAGPNEMLRVAVCGVNGRGMEHIQGWGRLKDDVRITTICDVDLNVTGQAEEGRRAAVSGRAEGRAGRPPGARRQVDRRDLDRHAQPLARARWRSGPARPARTSTSRSRSATTSPRAAGWSRPRGSTTGSSRPGTQCRSHKGIQDAMAFLHSGKLGQVYMAKGLCYKPRGSIGHKPDEPVPAGPRLRPLARPGAEAAVQPATGSTTTGTGSGTSATATSATRASTRWTWPAGAWARTSCPRP